MNDVLEHNNGNESGEDNTINGNTDYYFEAEMVDIYDSSGNYLYTERGLTTTLWIKVHGEWQQYTMGNEAWDELQKQFSKHGINPTARTHHVRRELMGT